MLALPVYKVLPAALQLAERPDRTGTIAFGTYAGNMPEWMAGTWPGAGSQLPPRFEMIANVRAVYDRIRDAHRNARLLVPDCGLELSPRSVGRRCLALGGLVLARPGSGRPRRSSSRWR